MSNLDPDLKQVKKNTNGNESGLPTSLSSEEVEYVKEQLLELVNPEVCEIEVVPGNPGIYAKQNPLIASRLVKCISSFPIQTDEEIIWQTLVQNWKFKNEARNESLKDFLSDLQSRASNSDYLDFNLSLLNDVVGAIYCERVVEQTEVSQENLVLLESIVAHQGRRMLERLERLIDEGHTIHQEQSREEIFKHMRSVGAYLRVGLQFGIDVADLKNRYEQLVIKFCPSQPAEEI